MAVAMGAVLWEVAAAGSGTDGDGSDCPCRAQERYNEMRELNHYKDFLEPFSVQAPNVTFVGACPPPLPAPWPPC